MRIIAVGSAVLNRFISENKCTLSALHSLNACQYLVEIYVGIVLRHILHRVRVMDRVTIQLGLSTVIRISRG